MELVPLGSLARIELGKMLSARNQSAGLRRPYLRNLNVQWDRIELSDVAEMTFDEEELSRFRLQPGDLLVCEGGEPGRAALWRGEITECYYQKALHRIRPLEGVMAEYLLFALWHLANQRAFVDKNAKTTIAHLPLERLTTVLVPKLGIEKQQVLVSRVRSQLSLAAAATAGQRSIVNDDVPRLEGAVLRAAFGLESAPILVGTIDRMKDQWRPLTSLARLESGHTPSRRRPEWWGGDVPWLALPDIRKLHGLIAHDTIECTNELGLANSSARLLPTGTVCVSRTASIGFVTMLGRPMATSQDFCNWVCDSEKLDAEFLMFAFMASQDYLRELGSGAVHKTIYMPAIESFRLWTPPLSEQRRIASQLRNQLREARQLRTKLVERQALIERLPQRILAEAFGAAY
jgi:type I restriction enzyme S subunit